MYRVSNYKKQSKNKRKWLKKGCQVKWQNRTELTWSKLTDGWVGLNSNADKQTQFKLDRGHVAHK